MLLTIKAGSLGLTQRKPDISTLSFSLLREVKLKRFETYGIAKSSLAIEELPYRPDLSAENAEVQFTRWPICRSTSTLFGQIVGSQPIPAHEVVDNWETRVRQRNRAS